MSEAEAKTARGELQPRETPANDGLGVLNSSASASESLDDGEGERPVKSVDRGFVAGRNPANVGGEELLDAPRNDGSESDGREAKSRGRNIAAASEEEEEEKEASQPASLPGSESTSPRESCAGLRPGEPPTFAQQIQRARVDVHRQDDDSFASACDWTSERGLVNPAFDDDSETLRHRASAARLAGHKQDPQYIEMCDLAAGKAGSGLSRSEVERGAWTSDDGTTSCPDTGTGSRGHLGLAGHRAGAGGLTGAVVAPESLNDLDRNRYHPGKATQEDAVSFERETRSSKQAAGGGAAQRRWRGLRELSVKGLRRLTWGKRKSVSSSPENPASSAASSEKFCPSCDAWRRSLFSTANYTVDMVQLPCRRAVSEYQEHICVRL